jgi:hypothetical protein
MPRVISRAGALFRLSDYFVFSNISQNLDRTASFTDSETPPHLATALSNRRKNSREEANSDDGHSSEGKKEKGAG